MHLPAQEPAAKLRRSLTHYFFALLAGAIALTTLAAGAASAEDNVIWQVQPAGSEGPGQRPYFVYDVAPGATIEDTMIIGNLSEIELPLRAFGTDALNAEDGRFDLLETDATPEDVGTWVTLDLSESEGDADTIVVPPGEEREVAFTINVPDNATPGDHVGGVVTSFMTETEGTNGELVRLDSRVAARIYLFVQGEIDASLQISDIDVDYDGSFFNPFSGNLNLSWTIENVGNIRLYGAQQVSVSGLAGLGAQSVEMDLPEVLPGNSVRQSVQLTGVPAAVRLNTDIFITPMDPANRLADPAEPTGVNLAIWAIPWFAILILAVVAAITWSVLRSRRRKDQLIDELRGQVEEQEATKVP